WKDTGHAASNGYSTLDRHAARRMWRFRRTGSHGYLDGDSVQRHGALPAAIAGRPAQGAEGPQGRQADRMYAEWRLPVSVRLVLQCTEYLPDRVCAGGSQGAIGRQPQLHRLQDMLT